MLYIVATPIGNLKDITVRAIEILKKVDFVIAEDTRRTGILLKHYNLPKKRFISFYKDNEKRRIESIIAKLKQGAEVALVSNAGTPCISDPGDRLIKRCLEENIKVTSLPGASAVTNALVLSGFPASSYLFLGFLPKKKTVRERKLKEVRVLNTTLVIFESPYRLLKLLSELKESLGEKNCAVIREMTKLYEEVRRDKITSLIEYFSNKKVKGEITVVVDNRSD